MLDYFPTTLEILGFRIKGQPSPIDGVSLVPLFEGRMEKRPVPIPFVTLGGSGTHVSRGSPRFALVGNRFKLLTDHPGQPEVLATDELFDLITDPRETTNLAKQRPAVVRSMKDTLAKFRISYERSLQGKDYSEPFTATKYDIPPYDPGYVLYKPWVKNSKKRHAPRQ